MITPLKKCYWKLLGWAKKPRRFPEIFGSVFAEQFHFLQQSCNWSEQEIIQWQNEKFSKLVTRAYNNTKFYRQLYDRHGINPEEIKTIGDAKKLPVITKADLNLHGQDMVDKTIAAENLFKHTTSGSTGVPTTLWRLSGHDMYIDWAFLYRQWHQAGWRWGDKVLRIRGLVGKDDSGDNFKVKMLKPENIMAVSATEMSAKNYGKLLALMQWYKPDYLEMYPSAFRLFSGLVKSNNDIESLKRPKAVFCESETITYNDRQLARQLWHCEIFGGYGNSERSVDAVECPSHNGYHVNYEYGFVELLDEKQDAILDDKTDGDIVTTGLLTDAMPLIRFNTADRARWQFDKCSCGRLGQMLAGIEGRRQDMLVTADDRIISIGAINHMANMDWLMQYQFRQSEAGKIEFAYMAIDDNEQNRNRFAAELLKMFRNKMEISFTPVESFELSARSKHKLVVQNLDIDKYLSGAAL